MLALRFAPVVGSVARFVITARIPLIEGFLKSVGLIIKKE
jgi:hypothetical protein